MGFRRENGGRPGNNDLGLIPRLVKQPTELSFSTDSEMFICSSMNKSVILDDKLATVADAYH